MAISQPRNRTRSGSRASAPLRPPPGEMDLLLGVRKTGMTPEARRSLCPRQARPGCSTRAFAAPDRRVIESQSVRLSANFLRPERRSTDGQVILKRTSGRSENRPDLLFCGAPLRNRTVDLLLTMDHQSVPVPSIWALTSLATGCRQRTLACTGPRGLHSAPGIAPRNDLGGIIHPRAFEQIFACRGRSPRLVRVDLVPCACRSPPRCRAGRRRA
jgi:hypothetical protein